MRLLVAVALASLVAAQPQPSTPTPNVTNMTNTTNATVPALYNLTDADFDMKTRAMAGMTAGQWFVSFCYDVCPVEMLWQLAEQLKKDNSTVSVARVDCDESLALAVRFDVVTATKYLFLKDSRMYVVNETSYDYLYEFFNASALELEGGPKIPRRAGPFKKLHDTLGDFFDVVDYRALCIALGITAVALVVIGAFMPHDPPPDDDKDKEEETPKPSDSQKKSSSGTKSKQRKKVGFEDR